MSSEATDPTSPSVPGSEPHREPHLDERAAEKLPHEALHLEALERMAGLAPYYGWVLDLAESLNGGPLGSRVLDAGCGIGNFVELLRQRTEHVMAVDLSPKNIAVLRRRFEDAANVEVLQTDLDAQREELRARDVDAICCLDVLEHIQDDGALVKSFAGILKEGGTLFIKVPAHAWLYGSVDKASDHFRRYSRKGLMKLVEGAGFEVRAARYMNLAGVGPYFLKSRVLKKGSTFSNSFTDRQLRWIKRSIGVFRGVDKVTGLVGPGGGPLAGQSVVLVARRQ